jgi:hypothetical protein
MPINITVDPTKELTTARGNLLDRCAAALGLPGREDRSEPDDYTRSMEDDKSYRKRLAAHLRSMADALEKS